MKTATVRPVDDLAAFLTARADELEAAAKAAAPGPWTGSSVYIGAPGAGVIVQARHAEDAAHIILNDPLHALALAQFMRAVADDLTERGDLRLSGHDDYYRGDADGRAAATRAIALWLARVYDDRPGFMPKWNPP